MTTDELAAELAPITAERRMLEHKMMVTALQIIKECADEAIGLFDQDEALRAIVEVASQARPEE